MSATVDVVVLVAGSGSRGDCYDVLVDWTESTRWNTLGNASGYSGDVSNIVAPAPKDGARGSIDVTTSVQAWVEGAGNFGWLFAPTNTDLVTIASSESDNVGNRPKLTVTYLL